MAHQILIGARRRPRLLVGALVVALAAPVAAAALAAQTQKPPVFTGGVDLIKVSVTVTDRERRFVPGLRKEDFVLSDDGRPQEIATFSSERAPVSLGVMFDSSRSMTPAKMASARSALTTFFNLLGREDELFFAEFSEGMRLLQGWTSDRALLQQAMLRVRGGSFTALYDCVKEALRTAVTGMHTRKALLLITDGDDTFSISSARAVRGELRGYDVMVYALGVQETAKGSKKVKEGTLRGLTDDTGGRTEVVNGFEALDETVKRLADELGQQYVLSYPPPAGPSRKWHDIKVEIPKQKQLIVRARKGYVSK
ncbi:MAG TPA: VWA domain-containing protein [Vicinamibacterales bacterium]|nr:VWA domain-containing protein [Vicinamibacterales bacterium]